MATIASPSTTNAINRERRIKSRKSAEDLFLVTVRMEPAGFGLMLDVSEGGLGVQVMNKVEPGTSVALHFTVPNSSKRVEGTGIVSWYDGQGRVGVRFQRLNNNSGDTLRQWVSTLPPLPAREPLRSAPPLPATTSATPASPAPQRTHASLKEQVRSIREQISAKHLELDLVLQFLVEKVAELTSSSGGAIALGTPDDMVCRASTGLAPDVGVRIGSGSALTTECLQTGKIVRCDDTETDLRVDREICRQLDLRSLLILPILREEKVAGVLEVFSPLRKAYGDQQFSMLKQLADFTAEIVYGTDSPKPETAKTPERIKTAEPVPQTAKLIPERPPVAIQPSKALRAPAATTVTTTAPVQATSPFLRAQQGTLSSASTTEAVPALKSHPPVARLDLEDEPEATRPFLIPSIIVLAALIAIVGLVWLFAAKGNRSTPQTAANSAGTQSQSASSTFVATDVLPETTPIVTGATTTSSAVRTRNVRSTPANYVADDTVTPVNPVPPPSSSAPEPSNEAPQITGASPSDAIASVSLPAFVSTPRLKEERKAGGNLTGGTLLHHVPPIYPRIGREQHYEGNVLLSARITKDGTVENVKRVSGNPVLGNAAVLAVRQWRYEPYKLNGQPQDVDTTITVHFQLK